GAPLALDLPLTTATATEPAPAAVHRGRLPDELVKRVEVYAAECGVTQFMLYAAAYAALLSRWTGQDEVVFGLPESGRGDAATHATYGLFVNTLPLRVRIGADDDWNALVARVRDAALDAYTYADVPLDQLAARLRELPLQALLVVQPDDMPLPELPGVESPRLPVDHHHTKLDLLPQVDYGRHVVADRGEPEHGPFAALAYRADDHAAPAPS